MSKLPALTPDDPLRVVVRPSSVNTPAAPNALVAAPDDVAPENAGGRGVEAASPLEPAKDSQPASSQRSDRPHPLTAASERRTAQRSARPATSSSTVTTGLELSGASDVITHRAPSELLKAFHKRVHELQLPKGMTVAAAVEQLLQHDDADLIELVENMEQRFENGRRRARRAA
jgi:hypothetical protein